MMDSPPDRKKLNKALCKGKQGTEQHAQRVDIIAKRQDEDDCTHSDQEKKHHKHRLDFLSENCKRELDEIDLSHIVVNCCDQRAVGKVADLLWAERRCSTDAVIKQLPIVEIFHQYREIGPSISAPVPMGLYCVEHAGESDITEVYAVHRVGQRDRDSDFLARRDRERMMHAASHGFRHRQSNDDGCQHYRHPATENVPLPSSQLWNH